MLPLLLVSHRAVVDCNRAVTAMAGAPLTSTAVTLAHKPCSRRAFFSHRRFAAIATAATSRRPAAAMVAAAPPPSLFPAAAVEARPNAVSLPKRCCSDPLLRLPPSICFYRSTSAAASSPVPQPHPYFNTAAVSACSRRRCPCCSTTVISPTALPPSRCSPSSNAITVHTQTTTAAIEARPPQCRCNSSPFGRTTREQTPSSQ